MVRDDTPIGTRERLIGAMLELLRRKGFHGFGLSDLLARAEAPKGVLYYHFPGGKVELAIAAIEKDVSQIIAVLEQLRTRDPNPVQVMRLWLDHAQSRLEESGFERGCALGAIALESTAADLPLRQALNDGFDAIRSTLAGMLAGAGMTKEKAARFSTLIISAYEGALLQSRVAGSTGPARETLEALLHLIQMEMDRERRQA